MGRGKSGLSPKQSNQKGVTPAAPTTPEVDPYSIDASEFDYKFTKGSPKQIEWAVDIYQKAFETINNELQKLKSGSTTVRDAADHDLYVEAYKRAWDSLKRYAVKTTDAERVIDNRRTLSASGLVDIAHKAVYLYKKYGHW